MTQDERDVLNAAIRAVHVEERGKIVVADISKDANAIGDLIRAVAKLQRSRQDYWRET